MRLTTFKGCTPFVVLSTIVFILSAQFAQAQVKIDWSRDSVSRTDAMGCKSTYINTIKGSGQKNATEQVTIQTGKLKTVIDACVAKGITEISFVFATIRQQDIARYRRAHPESTATDDQLKGSQVIIIKVPRRAFEGAMGARVNLSSSPIMISLLSIGLVWLDKPYGPADASGDVFLDLGTICPPPTSCD